MRPDSSPGTRGDGLSPPRTRTVQVCVPRSCPTTQPMPLHPLGPRLHLKVTCFLCLQAWPEVSGKFSTAQCEALWAPDSVRWGPWGQCLQCAWHVGRESLRSGKCYLCAPICSPAGPFPASEPLALPPDSSLSVPNWKAWGFGAGSGCESEMPATGGALHTSSAPSPAPLLLHRDPVRLGGEVTLGAAQGVAPLWLPVKREGAGRISHVFILQGPYF